MQVMEAVQSAVQIGVLRFTQQSQVVGSNEMAIQDGGAYRFPARTREQVLQSAGEVAEQRAIDPRARFSQLHDPAVSELGAPSVDIFKTDSGLVLPRGVKPPQPERKVDEGANGRHDDGPVPWLL